MKPEMIDTSKGNISVAMEIGIGGIEGQESLIVKGLMDDDKLHYTFIPIHLFSEELLEGVLCGKEIIQEIKQELN